MAEGARLEIVCGFIAHRGFESLPLRHMPLTMFVPARQWPRATGGRELRQVRKEATVSVLSCVPRQAVAWLEKASGIWAKGAEGER